MSGADQMIKSLDCPSGWKWDPGPMRSIWGLKGICKNGESLVLPTCTIILNNAYLLSVQFSSVQLLSHVWLFATPWIAAHQASLSISNTQSLLKLMPIELMMPSSNLILCHPLLLLPPIPPSIRVVSSGSTLHMSGQSTGVSASASVLPMNTQDWSPLGWTGWISLQSQGLSRVFSNTTVQEQQFFGVQVSSQSNSHIHTWPLEKP